MITLVLPAPFRSPYPDHSRPLLEQPVGFTFRTKISFTNSTAVPWTILTAWIAAITEVFAFLIRVKHISLGNVHLEKLPDNCLDQDVCQMRGLRI